MEEYPKVSIITPSYNQAKFLEYTIESVLNQKYPNLEYIIVDGASNDNSLNIIQKYANQYPFIKWISEKDKGQSDAINKGFKMASGEIVAWLNSDDTYNDNAIINAVKYLNSHPEVSLVYGKANLIDENNQVIGEFPFAEEFSLDRLINYNIFIMQPTAFWRYELFTKIGFLNESLKYTMDWDFWIRAGKTCKLAYYPILVANTREYQTTKTFGGGFERLKEIRKIFRTYSKKKYPPLYFNLVLDTIYKKMYKYSPLVANSIKRVLKIFIEVFKK